MRTDRRLLMIGLDAVSMPFIQDNLSKLPVFASLLQTGTLRKLQSPAAYFSDSIWPTFASGKTPGEHGQYFPFQWVAEHGEYRRIADPRWSEELDVEPFWHRIARAGVPAIAFDVAHTLHDKRAPCLQITNWSYQSSGNARASQPEVLKDLRRRLGHRPIGVEVPVPKTARQCDAIRDRLIAAVRAKADAALDLMNRPWNLFVTGWFELHRAGHNLWPVDGDFGSDASPDAMLAVYEETDWQLGRVIAAAEAKGGETSLLLFALHGMEPNRTQVHFLTEILLRLNCLYLGVKPKRSSKPAALNPMAFLRHVLPPGLQHWAANVLGERVQDWVVNRSLTGGREWSATPSFPILSGGEGLIRLNVKGRETPGFFEPGSAELSHYAKWLIARLSAIEVAGTGEPLIGRIVNVDEELPGPRRHFLPDLILEWAPEAPVDRIRSPDFGEIEISLATGRGGNHNASAFMIAKGGEAFLEAVEPVHDVADLGDVAEAYLLGESDARVVVRASAI
ncbi:MAG: alkaline phosphatase family protein [Sphingomicrobium sp.]